MPLPRLCLILSVFLTSVAGCASRVLAQAAVAPPQLRLEFDSPASAKTGIALLRASQRDLGRHEGATYRLHPLRSSRAAHVVITSGLGEADVASLPRLAKVTRGLPVFPRARIPDDPRFGEQYNLELLEVPAAWEYTTGGTSGTGRRVVTGIIEANGFALDFPELRDKYWVNPLEVPGDGVDNDNNGFVDDVSGWNFDSGDEGPRFSTVRTLHGVHTSSIIAADADDGVGTAGMLWDGTLLPLEVTNTLEWERALDYLTAQRERYDRSGGAAGAYVTVASMSLGIDDADCGATPELNDAFDRAGRAGILLISATSNDLGDIDRRPELPGTCASEFLVSVTATDRADGVFGTSGTSATFVDLGAPGDAVPVPQFAGARVFTGTSASAPQVAAVASLIYSLDCAGLDALADADPAAATRLVRDILFESVDRLPGLEGLVATGGRVNARRALELALQRTCGAEGYVVRFDSAAAGTPPAVIDLAGGPRLTLARTLSAEWSVHLYREAAAGGSGLEASSVLAALTARADVRGAEGNVRFLLRGRVPTDPGYPAQEAAEALGLPAAWEAVYGPTAVAPRSPVVSAVFDQGFDFDAFELADRVYENPDEVPDNGIDDDGNGFVDDVRGVLLDPRAADFSPGGHGTAVVNILAADPDDGRGIAGVDWGGSVLPLQGSTLAEWVAGADYAARLRRRYNASGGAGGALVASYLSAQGGPRIVGAGGAGIVDQVVADLVAVGIVPVFAARNDAPGRGPAFPSDDLAAEGSIVAGSAPPRASDPVDDLRDLPGSVLLFPADRVTAGFTAAFDTARLSGSSAAGALAAGMVALVYQTACADYLAAAVEAPAATAAEVARVVRLGARRGNDYRGAVANAALALGPITGACEGDPPACAIVRVYPSPAPGPSGTQHIVVAAPNSPTCRVRVVDAAGRVVVDGEVATGLGLGELALRAGDGLRQGVYFALAGDGEDGDAVPFVR